MTVFTKAKARASRVVRHLLLSRPRSRHLWAFLTPRLPHYSRPRTPRGRRTAEKGRGKGRTRPRAAAAVFVERGTPGAAGFSIIIKKGDRHRLLCQSRTWTVAGVGSTCRLPRHVPLGRRRIRDAARAPEQAGGPARAPLRVKRRDIGGRGTGAVPTPVEVDGGVETIGGSTSHGS